MKTLPRLLLIATLTAGLPALAAPPDHAPAHGYRAKHSYVYYREREIYYAPETRLWFWLDGGSWRFGAGLPVGYQQYTSGGITIELDSDRPYTEHRYVVETYGKGPKGKKHKHDKPHKHHD
jgi:hypothetical protein